MTIDQIKSLNYVIHEMIQRSDVWALASPYLSLNLTNPRQLLQDLHHLGSEWDIMQHLGWNRFWDCGNSVWVWQTAS